MSKLEWDKTGERLYHLGVDRGVVFPMAKGKYITGAPWNGLTAVNESPDGADPNDIYADNIKYASIRSAENFKYTLEALTYPPEFEQCDGSVEVAKGVSIGQQKRCPFGLSYRTRIGADDDPEKGYIIHLVWNSTASPSDKSHETVNENPDAETFSWECDTTPTQVTGYKPTAHMTINSTLIEAAKLKLLKDYPGSRLCGHRDLSPDLNHNGEIEPEEWIKQCPCFEVRAENFISEDTGNL